jgi:hypothetical protein
LPPIRVVAFAALILIAVLAAGILLPGETSFADRLGQLAVLLVAAGNAGAVTALARTRPSAMAGVGLGLILLGVALALALATISYWFDRVWPPDGSFFGMIEQIGLAVITLKSLFGAGLAALALGWSCWGVSRFAARRAARVASAPQLPI